MKLKNLFFFGLLFLNSCIGGTEEKTHSEKNHTKKLIDTNSTINKDGILVQHEESSSSDNYESYQIKTETTTESSYETNSSYQTKTEDFLSSVEDNKSSSGSENQNRYNIRAPKPCDRKYQLLRLSHNVNTSANEYLPCYDVRNKELYFTGMDRTGFFNHKIDFTKTREFGGEDVFVSKMQDGLFSNAIPVKSVNTNGHESINQILRDGSLILSGNYQENIGPGNDENGSATEDIFQAFKNGSGYRLFHFEEPVNSIYTEIDGFMPELKDIILFSSDRPKGIGAYHKKGWMWNSNYWGNTDIYVAFSENGNWSSTINLGSVVNTPFAERTPYLSPDGLTLYLSSNGHKEASSDMDIYYFKRKDKNNWTEWDGPYCCNSLNSNKDDWGYKEFGELAFFSRSEELKFIPTAKARNGTGFVFETNFRSGYTINGAQSGSFKAKEQTDIFMAQSPLKPSFTLPDALFDVDKSEIRKDLLAVFSEKLLDVIKMNSPINIRLEGYTDSQGTEEHNKDLSIRRAETVKQIILESGFSPDKISILGFGSSKPIDSNTTESGRQKNRRVEVYFE